jgi:Arc/MetJ family transcription regulator
MGITEDLADALARDTIAVAEKLGDDNLIAEVSKVIGASSTTTQEAFMTAVRVRLSEKRARAFLKARLAKGSVGPKKELGTGPILDPSDDSAGGH